MSRIKWLFATLLLCSCDPTFAQTTAYYITDIIGDGKTIETAYRSSVVGLPGVSHISIFTNKPDGSLKLPWALVIVTAVDHSVVTKLTTVTALPIVDKTSQIALIPAQVKVDFVSKLSIKSIPSTVIDAAVTGADLITNLGKLHDSQFSSDKLVPPVSPVVSNVLVIP